MTYFSTRLKWYREYKKDPKTRLKVFLLKTCPYSKKLADAIRRESRVEKKWVSRGSKTFFDLKNIYGSQTFPIVVVSTTDQDIHIGGFSDYQELRGRRFKQY